MRTKESLNLRGFELTLSEVRTNVVGFLLDDVWAQMCPRNESMIVDVSELVAVTVRDTFTSCVIVW